MGVNGDRDRDRDRDRYPERYPPDRYGDRRYPDRDRERDRDRDRDRLPYRPLPYPAINDNSLPSDLPHTRPFPIDDDAPYRPYGYGGGGVGVGLGGGRYGDNRYDNRYPSRYPPSRDPVGGYTGRDAPDSIFPDRRYRPSSMDPQRYPYAPDSRAPPGRYDDIVHSARRPEPESAKRYPPAPLAPTGSASKYASNPNRFPVGNDRYPIDIYKYGNRLGGSDLGRRPGK